MTTTSPDRSITNAGGVHVGHRRDLGWIAVTVVVVSAGACLPLLFNVAYYFVDDSQADMYGKLWQIGERITSGDWSLVNPWAWQAGNYLADGYWGVLSPLLWLFGLFVHAAPNALIAMTALKLVLFAGAAAGAFLLARSFGASAPWSSIAGVSVPLAGFTLYMDATSWMNGFTAWAITPVAWYLVRRFVIDRRLLLLMFAAVYSVVSINYVHATLMLGLIIAATGIEAIVARSGSRIRGAVYVGLLWGFATIVIHLPGLLTAPASTRVSTIENNGMLVADLSDVTSAAIGTGTPHLQVFGLDFAPAPLMYIAWFLPILALVDYGALRAVWRHLLSAVIITCFTALAVMGPSDLGPLRFPVRVTPYLALGVLVVTAVLMTRAPQLRATRRRVFLMLALYAVPALLALLNSPRSLTWIGIVGIASVVGLLALVSSVNGSGPLRRMGEVGRAAGVFAVTLAVVGIQHVPASAAPMSSYSVPTAVKEYQTQLADARGDVLIVGSPLPRKTDPEIWDDTLVGNLWYPNGTRVQNLYTAVGNPGYVAKTCMTYNGPTCDELIDSLFEPQPETGSSLVDLLSVSTIQYVKPTGKDQSLLGPVPSGWTLVDETPLTATIVRENPVPTAGSVVWEEAGTSIEMVSADAMGASFRVESVPATGGRVALSRIPWPGYVVDGAELDEDMTEGVLMGIDIGASAEGSLVTVAFVMPGLPLVIGSASAALVLLLVGAVRPLRRRVLIR